MSDWSEWRDLEKSYEDPNSSEHGVYEIRLVRGQGQVIEIPRLGGIDKEGIYYIGRTGPRTSKTDRSFWVRITEFIEGRHSGGNLYALVATTLKEKTSLKGHALQYRVRVLADGDIENIEALLLHLYLATFCELPPGNRGLPKKDLSQLQGYVRITQP